MLSLDYLYNFYYSLLFISYKDNYNQWVRKNRVREEYSLLLETIAIRSSRSLTPILDPDFTR